MSNFFAYLAGIAFGADGVLTFLDWDYPPVNAQIHHYHQVVNWIWLATMACLSLYQWRNRPAAIAERAKSAPVTPYV